MLTPPCACGFYCLRGTVAFFVFVYMIGVIMFLGMEIGEMKGAWYDHKGTEPAPSVCEIEGTSACDLVWANSRPHVKHGVACYYYESTHMTWPLARQECQSGGGDLVKINSNDVNAAVLGLCDGGTESCWIGLYQPNGGEGTNGWVWSVDDSAPTAYSNWFDWPDAMPVGDEPNNGAGGDPEDHAAMFTSHNQKELEDGIGFMKLMTILIFLLLLGACTTMGFLSVCGVVKDNRCCIIVGLSGDATCGGLMCCLAIMTVMSGNFIGFIMATLVALSMVIISIYGCIVCGRAGQGYSAQQNTGPPVIVGVAQPQVAVVGQVIG